MTHSPFSGFSKNTLQFLTDLEANNNKPWFDTHRSDYDNYFLAPARDFVVALGERLRALSPDVVADPRVNKSIFRIYRDIRFSKDKTPYKSHLGLWFPVSGSGGKFENPGYYFHVEPKNLMLGVGIHAFTKPLLKAYRDAVVEPNLGTKLSAVIAARLLRSYNIKTKTYKRVPRGYDPDHEYKDLLLHSGLTSGIDLKIPPELHTPDLVDYCFHHFQELSPIVSWLESIKERFGV